jgi:hypothetical protein
VWDLSRAAETAGSEIPIVRENRFTTGTIALLGIPVAPHYRHTLRVYDFDGHTGSRVAIRVYANDELDPRAAIRGVRDDLVDVAIACLPAPVSGLTVTPIGEDGVVVALPDTHPGIGQAAFPVQQLDEVAPIMLAREANPPFYDGVLAAARDASVMLHTTRASAPSVEHALLRVVCGRVPALLPASVAERHMLRGVCFLALAEPMPRSVVTLVSNPSTVKPQVAEFIRLAAALGQYGRSVTRPAMARAA